MREVTLVFVNEETGQMRLLLGSGKTFTEAIDAAVLQPEMAEFDGLTLAAVFPGKLGHDGMRLWLETLTDLAEGSKG